MTTVGERVRQSLPTANRLWARVREFCESEEFLWLIILVGVVLRCRQYLANRSLWFDEASLALNVINRSFLQLLTPLDYDQGAPVGFLIIERLAVQVLGSSSYALRLFPLLSAVASLLLLRTVAKRYLTAGAVPLALGLFALLEPLVYYASEVKQYSSDVLVALILYGAALSPTRQKFTASRVACLGLAGAVAVWFSHPSVFFLAGIGTILVALRLAQKDWPAVGGAMAVCSAWALSIATAYALSFRYLHANPFLLDFWSRYFLPFPPLSASDLTWPIWMFFEFEITAGFELPGLAAFALLAGCYSMFLRDKTKLSLLLCSAPFVVLASSLHLYPLGGRLLLFAVPGLVLLVAEGAEWLRVTIVQGARILWVAFVALLILQPLLVAGQCFFRPRTVEEIEPVLGYIADNWREGDLLYVYWRASKAFAYYAPAYGLHNTRHILGVDRSTDWDDYWRDLQELRGNSRVWLLFAHLYGWEDVGEQRFFIYSLDGMGTPLDLYTAPGARAYLYDLSRSPTAE